MEKILRHPIMIIVLMIVLLVVSKNAYKGNGTATGNSVAVLNDLTDNHLKYTRHAKERMSCRHITKAEVNEMLERGEVNYRKSEPNDQPCPTYAIEGITSDNQEVRIVFADCDDVTKVITAIDIGEDHVCH